MSAMWPGASGRHYEYWSLPSLLSKDIKKQPGNYMFIKQVIGGWVPVYIGIADDLSTRLPGHNMIPEAVKLGATHVLAATNENRVAREAEEQDLIGYWNPVLNTHYRSLPGALGLGGLALFSR